MFSVCLCGIAVCLGEGQLRFQTLAVACGSSLWFRTSHYVCGYFCNVVVQLLVYFGFLSSVKQSAPLQILRATWLDSSHFWHENFPFKLQLTATKKRCFVASFAETTQIIVDKWDTYTAGTETLQNYCRWWRWHSGLYTWRDSVWQWYVGI